MGNLGGKNEWREEVSGDSAIAEGILSYCTRATVANNNACIFHNSCMRDFEQFTTKSC